MSAADEPVMPPRPGTTILPPIPVSTSVFLDEGTPSTNFSYTASMRELPLPPPTPPKDNDDDRPPPPPPPRPSDYQPTHMLLQQQAPSSFTTAYSSTSSLPSSASSFGRFGGGSTVAAPKTNWTLMTELQINELVWNELVREAGLTNEGRPLLVFYSCNLPDPKSVDYDALLDKILHRIETQVERDYAIVIFSAGLRYQPSWSWVFKAYQRLNRKYRKNLKSLYIVHPSMWAKLLLQMMGAIISHKFSKKLVWVNNLSTLERLVPLHQIYIPDIITQVNKKYESGSPVALTPSAASANIPPPLPPRISTASITAGPPSQNSPVRSQQNSTSATSSTSPPKASPPRQFGVPLEVLMGSEGQLGLPRVIVETVEFIRNNGLTTEGIFRRSPSSQLVNPARDAYDRNVPHIDLEAMGGIHLACVLLKLFLREMPRPIIESGMYDIFRQIESPQNSSSPTNQALFIKSTVLPLLPAPTLLLLRHIFALLHTVHLNASQNLMTSYNIAIVFAPNLVRGGSPVVDMGMCAVGPGGGGVGTFVKICVEHWHVVFEGVGDALLRAAAAREDEETQILTSQSPNLTPGGTTNQPLVIACGTGADSLAADSGSQISPSRRSRSGAQGLEHRRSVVHDAEAGVVSITTALGDSKLANASKANGGNGPTGGDERK